jgi:NADH dehydrogenase FAD-containing subunit
MKRLLVLGAGTAGTMLVNKLRKRLDDGREYAPRSCLTP